MKFALEGQFGVTSPTSEVLYAIAFIQCCDNIAGYSPVAYKADIAKQLIEMCLTVRQSIFLVMSVPIEGLLALCTAEMIDMPLLAKSIDNTIFYRTPASPTNRGAHFVMTTQAIQFIVPLSAVDVKLFVARVAVIMPRVHRFTHIHDMASFFDVCMASITHVPPTFGFL